MGVIGVIILVQGGIATRTDDWGMAVAAALLSTIFYGIAGTYVKASPNRSSRSATRTEACGRRQF